jgi:ATP-dependent DNA helicase RecG
MNLEQLKKLIHDSLGRESKELEFKKSMSLLKSAITTICAYLNDNGGKVILGVKNDGTIIGDTITDNTQQEIAKELVKIEPSAQIKVEYVPVSNNKHVVVLSASKGNYLPYIYEGRPYYRTESSTSIMPQHLYEQLLVERGQLNHNWEGAFVNDCTINDLDLDEIHKTILEGVQENRVPASAIKDAPEEVLARFGLIEKGKLKRAAIVLFAKDGYVKFRQCKVKLARFNGVDNLGDFIDNQQIYGNSFRLLKEIEIFLNRHLPIASFFSKTEFIRSDKPILPIIAIREAVINALAHRDYSHSGTSITVAIYDDRLEIWNSGRLPKSLTISALKQKHRSILRNELIADIFYARGMIEAWGTGTNKMMTLCKKEGLPEPIFEENTEGLSVIFRFKESLGSKQHLATMKASYDELADQQKKIISILRAHGKLSPKELISMLDYETSDKTLRKELNKLQDLGLVYSEGETKSRRWGSLI